MKSDLSKIKVGDRIWTIQQGWVTVERTNCGGTYPIRLSGRDYTIDGKNVSTDVNPSAFTFNPFEQPQPFEGYWAMVSDRPLDEVITGAKRFVFAEKNGKFIAWSGAETDEEVKEATSVTGWEYAQRIPEPSPIPEYTVEELTALVGHEFKFKK